MKEDFNVPVNCKMCGASNADGIQYCSACGTPLKDVPMAAASPVKSPVKSPSVESKTMLFNKAPNAPTAAPADAKSKTSTSQKTMLGAPAVQLPNQKPVPSGQAPVAQPKKTAPAPVVNLAPPKATTQPAPAAGGRAKTVLGLPTASPADVAAAVEAAKNKPAPASATAPANAQSQPQTSNAAQPTGNIQRTMLQPPPEKSVQTQLTAPVEASPPAAAPTAAASGKAAAAGSNASEPVPSAPEPRPGVMSQQYAPQPNPAAIADDVWPEGEPPTHPKSSMGIIISIAIAAVIIVGLIAFILFRFVFPPTTSFEPQILPSHDGETLTVVLSLPDAAPGAVLQFQNQNIPIAGGKVQFLIQKKQMALGANLVKVMLAEPGATPTEISFPIMLRHVATNDFSKLAESPPSIDVRFQVAAGFSIKVNGTPCPLEDGVCTFNLAVNATQSSKAKTLQYAIPFELVDASGRADPGQHIITVPVTAIQLDRPAEGAIVATPKVTVAGSAVPGTVLTIDGIRVTAGDAGFSTSVPLKTVGVNEIKLKAVAPDSAPNIRDLKVTRVTTLKPYVDKWSADLDASFNFALLSRDTGTHTGKKIHLSGRIININTARGVTAFLMYVDQGCPQGGQCGVYVAFRGETDAGLQSMVDVYGTVRGTQDVDFAGGTSKTLPAIDAAYVVPVESRTK